MSSSACSEEEVWLVQRPGTCAGKAEGHTNAARAPPDIMGQDVSSKAQQGAWSHLKASLGQEAPLPRQLIYVAGRVVLTASERPKFSST